MIGLVLAFVGIFATQIPKDSFEALGLAGAYGWYRLSLVALLAVLLLVLWLWRHGRRVPRKSQATTLTGAVLEYLKIKMHLDRAEPADRSGLDEASLS